MSLVNENEEEGNRPSRAYVENAHRRAPAFSFSIPYAVALHVSAGVVGQSAPLVLFRYSQEYLSMMRL